MAQKEITCPACPGTTIRVDDEIFNRTQEVKCIACGRKFTYVIRHQEILKPVGETAKTGQPEGAVNGKK